MHLLGSKVCFWSYYVNDFLVVKYKNLSEILQTENSISPAIQFTVKIESDRNFSFQDALIERVRVLIFKKC